MRNEAIDGGWVEAAAPHTKLFLSHHNPPVPPEIVGAQAVAGAGGPGGGQDGEVEGPGRGGGVDVHSKQEKGRVGGAECVRDGTGA